MSRQTIEKVLSELKGSGGSYPFGPEVLVFKVMGKVFALLAQNEDILRITLKCVPADAEMLVSQFKSIIPGYHMNKKHWITLSLTDEVPEEMLIELIDNSYKLIVSKLTKVDKALLSEL